MTTGDGGGAAMANTKAVPEPAAGEPLDDGRPFSALFAQPLHGVTSEGEGRDVLEQRTRLFGRYRPTGARDKVMVLSVRGEAHADAVIRRLLARGVPVCRIDVDTLGSTFRLSLSRGTASGSGNSDGGFSARVSVPAGEFDSREIRSVWLNRPVFELFGAGPTRDNLASFVRREQEAALRGLFDLLHDSSWLNPPAALYAATGKLTQLRLAEAVGFALPRTLVTNDPGEAARFYEDCGRQMIAKAFRGEIGSGWHDTEVVYSQRIGDAHLGQLPRLRHAPCIFQELVPKASEIRVTMVGKQLFPVEARFRAAHEPPDDYRRPGVEVAYAPCRIPAAIEQACARLLERCGLRFGAVDLIRRPDGGFVFLELNAFAAWLWLEQLTGARISDAVADALVDGC